MTNRVGLTGYRPVADLAGTGGFEAHRFTYKFENKNKNKGQFSFSTNIYPIAFLGNGCS